jgi:RNA polymerase sigma factor (sigma-70 family)
LHLQALEKKTAFALQWQVLQEDENPLQTKSPLVWDRLIDAIGPASLLLVIESRMSAALQRQLSPEDIWQDALLHVWRDRAQCRWSGVRAFRAWVLSIIDNRIRDAADRIQAAKRGGGRPPVMFSALERSTAEQSGTAAFAGPAGSTTPSRVAIYREQAAAMHAALAELPDKSREIVRLRLFEQLPLREIAERVGIDASAVRRRLREGAELYQNRLTAALATRSQSLSARKTDHQLE